MNDAVQSRHSDANFDASTIDALRAEFMAAGLPVSLIAWKRRRPELAAIEDDVWLMNAYVSLRSAGFGVALVSSSTDPFAINEPFHDVELARLPGPEERS